MLSLRFRSTIKSIKKYFLSLFLQLIYFIMRPINFCLTLTTLMLSSNEVVGAPLFTPSFTNVSSSSSSPSLIPSSSSFSSSVSISSSSSGAAAAAASISISTPMPISDSQSDSGAQGTNNEKLINLEEKNNNNNNNNTPKNNTFTFIPFKNNTSSSTSSSVNNVETPYNIPAGSSDSNTKQNNDIETSEDFNIYSTNTDQEVTANAEWTFWLIWDNPNLHYHNERTDFVCDTYSGIFYPYTGYRLVRKYQIGATFADMVLEFVFCYRGREISRTEVVKDLDFGIEEWDDKFCIKDRDSLQPDGRGCFRIARRAIYKDAGFPLYARETFVGGLFKCPSNSPDDECDDNETVTPVAPLMADEPYTGFFEFHNPWKFFYREPLYYTPDYFSYMYPREDDLWARYIDINEEYGEPVEGTRVSKNGHSRRPLFNNIIKVSSADEVNASYADTSNEWKSGHLNDNYYHREDIDRNGDSKSENSHDHNFAKIKGLIRPHLPMGLYDSIFAKFSEQTFEMKIARVVSAMGAMPDRRLAADLYHQMVVVFSGPAAITGVAGALPAGVKSLFADLGGDYKGHKPEGLREKAANLKRGLINDREVFSKWNWVERYNSGAFKNNTKTRSRELENNDEFRPLQISFDKLNIEKVTPQWEMFWRYKKELENREKDFVSKLI